jgi:hypothetical protein
VFCAGQKAGVTLMNAVANKIFPTDVIMGIRGVRLPMRSVLAEAISRIRSPDAMLNLW